MERVRILRFIVHSVKPFKYLVIGQFFLATLWAINSSVRPYILKIIIDTISSVPRDMAVNALFWPGVLYCISLIFIFVVHRLHDIVWLYLNPLLKRRIGDILMTRMMKHSLTVFQNQFAGNLSNKIKDVMSSVPDILKICISQFCSHFLALIIAAFTIWSISYMFTLLLVSWIIIFISGTLFLIKQARELSHISALVRSKFVGYIVDILSNITSVHLFAAKQKESKNVRAHLNEYVIADQKRDWCIIRIFVFQGLSFVVYQVLCFIFLVLGFRDGNVTAGDAVLLFGINKALVNRFWSFSRDVMKLSVYLGNVSQGLEVVLSPIEIQNKLNATDLKVSHGAIVFDNVKFHYKGAEPLFHNESITIESGQKVGLVGYSGSGKTTFINLILRLYDVTGGRVLIDGQDICDVTQDSLHNAIAMIPQNPALFHRTVMENIRYGCETATDKQVKDAAKRAHAHDFIIKFPRGYNTQVGERGAKLSGGQRQRIAIARAILKDAPILILDEATSQLDSIVEGYIQESLWKLMQGKTTLVVAHRLSTLLHMDRILVFKQGNIIEDGSHAELFEKGGLYKTLWDAQVCGVLPDQNSREL